MKRTRFVTILLVFALIVSMPAMVVSGRAAGPFSAGDDFLDYYDEGGRDAFSVLQEALEGRTWIPDPQFVSGVRGFGGDEGEEIGSPYGEWTWNLFDMTWWKYNQDGGRRSSKYCGNEDMWWETHDAGYFFAVWRYDQAYVADAFLWANANDCEGNPRRMGDGWTISGGHGPDGPWTVLYTGQTEDYDNIDRTWWRMDLPNNTEAFQYYRLWADHPGDSGIIQLSNVALSGAPPAAPEPDPVSEEEPDAPAVLDAPETPVVPVGVPEVDTPKPAPQTVDPITLVAIGAIASIAGGAVIIKKRSK